MCRKPNLIAADIERLGMHPSLEALLHDLSRWGPLWGRVERDRWVSAFLLVLDYVHPIILGEADADV